MGNVFFHIDLDAFFASVEILDNPEYRGKPLIIGTPGRRSVAATCSYEARAFGVHSAMPMLEALRLCPNAICIPPRMNRYSEKSHEVMSIIESFAPGFLQVSIDEAFLDLSGMERIYPLAGKAAKELKIRIKEKTGLTVSIGVASSRFLSKLASDYHKPDGLTIVPQAREIEFIDAVGLDKLWGVGKSTREALRRKGISSTQKLREYSENELIRLFGDHAGTYLYQIVRAIDPGIYQGEAKSHSISTETTFLNDIYDKEILEEYMLEMSQDVMFRALEEGKIPRTVGLKLRYGEDFSTATIQISPKEEIYSSDDVYRILKNALEAKWDKRGIRLLGVSLQNTYESPDPLQRDLFGERGEKERRLEKTILGLSKNGIKMVKARSLKKNPNS